MSRSVKIGNAQAFWGDDPSAAENLVRAVPDLDYLTLDYLSEVSMSIMAIQRESDPQSGYAKDFLGVVAGLVPHWESGCPVKIVTNAGGLNPLGCARACQELLKKKCRRRRYLIAVISGDDVLARLQAAKPGEFSHLDSGAPLSMVKDSLVTANAYLGAMDVVDALKSGADIVIAGRLADPSMAVGPSVYHHGWGWEEYDKLAGATVAGHLIECGTQTTGGISTDWLEMDNPLNIGFPVAEVAEDGSAVVTKGEDTGGRVTCETVKEQLLYEIGDPGNYISPDVKVSFLGIKVEQQSAGRVIVKGARGKPPPFTLKVSATYRAGYKAESYLTIFGERADLKAQRCADVIRDKLRRCGSYPDRFSAECLGRGDCAPGIVPKAEGGLFECVLRLAVQDGDREKVERFSKEVASLVTCGPPGVTGYTSGRPTVRPCFGYWPCLIDAGEIRSQITILEVPPCQK